MTETLIPATYPVKISIGLEIEEAGSWSWLGSNLGVVLMTQQKFDEDTQAFEISLKYPSDRPDINPNYAHCRNMLEQNLLEVRNE